MAEDDGSTPMTRQFRDQTRMAQCHECRRLMPVHDGIFTWHFDDLTGRSRTLCQGSQQTPHPTPPTRKPWAGRAH